MTGLIYIPYWWHATLFEVLWLVFGVIAAAITTLNLSDSRRDRPVLEEIRRDPAVHDRHFQMIEIAAKGRESSQVIRLLISVLIVAPGVLGVLQANPLKGGTTWTAFLVTVALIGIAMLTAARSWLDYRERGRMMALAMGRSAVVAARMKINQRER